MCFRSKHKYNYSTLSGLLKAAVIFRPAHLPQMVSVRWPVGFSVILHQQQLVSRSSSSPERNVGSREDLCGAPGGSWEIFHGGDINLRRNKQPEIRLFVGGCLKLAANENLQSCSCARIPCWTLSFSSNVFIGEKSIQPGFYLIIQLSMKLSKPYLSKSIVS